MLRTNLAALAIIGAGTLLLGSPIEVGVGYAAQQEATCRRTITLDDGTVVVVTVSGSRCEIDFKEQTCTCTD